MGGSPPQPVGPPGTKKVSAGPVSTLTDDLQRHLQLMIHLIICAWSNGTGVCPNGARLWNKTYSGEEKESGITKKKSPTGR